MHHILLANKLLLFYTKCLFYFEVWINNGAIQQQYIAISFEFELMGNLAKFLIKTIDCGKENSRHFSIYA